MMLLSYVVVELCICVVVEFGSYVVVDLCRCIIDELLCCDVV